MWGLCCGTKGINLGLYIKQNKTEHIFNPVEFLSNNLIGFNKARGNLCWTIILYSFVLPSVGWFYCSLNPTQIQRSQGKQVLIISASHNSQNMWTHVRTGHGLVVDHLLNMQKILGSVTGIFSSSKEISSKWLMWKTFAWDPGRMPASQRKQYWP